MTKPQKPQTIDLTRLEGYDHFLQELKDRVRGSQLKAAVAVNSELIGLYWELGKNLVKQQERSGWGDAVLDRLSQDLVTAFPEMKGFSRRNLYRIRALYLAYRAESEFVPQAVAQIPWGHNIVILEKVKDPIERRWYVSQTTDYGWSRAVPTHQIESGLYRRKGNAISNFDRALPVPQSDLLMKRSKTVTTSTFSRLDRKPMNGIWNKDCLAHIRSFLLELGVGFAFVGSQYHLDVGDQDFYIGLRVKDVLEPPEDILIGNSEEDYNIFYIPEALGSPIIPAQKEFVEAYNIRSVLGFGSMLPSGDLFAVIIFSKVKISREVAEMFRCLALAANLALMRFLPQSSAARVLSGGVSDIL